MKMIKRNVTLEDLKHLPLYTFLGGFKANILYSRNNFFFVEVRSDEDEFYRCIATSLKEILREYKIEKEAKEPILISRYRFESLSSGMTFERTPFYTEEGAFSREHVEDYYFNKEEFKRTKIGESIPCPWKQDK